MNIHTKDENIVNLLNDATIFSCLVGSSMYGTSNSKSDKDYLHIYATSDIELINPFKVNHQIQYKKDNIDHNYVSLHSFISNICNGDSTINFEVLHTDELKTSPLSFLYENRKSFYSYTLLKSYIGMCRRDYKFYNKSDTLDNKIKKIKHIIRAVIFTKDIIDGKEISLINNDMVSEINLLYSMSGDELDALAAVYNDKNEELRIYVNQNINKFVRHINPESQYVVTKMLFYLCEDSKYKEKKLKNADSILKLYLDSYENYVNY